MQMKYLDTLRKGLIVCLIFWGVDCVSQKCNTNNQHLVKLSEMQSYFQRIGASAISKCKVESL